VYQGYARGQDLRTIEIVNDYAVGEVKPDLIIIFEAEYDELSARRAKRGVEDRFEREDEEFHKAVLEGFRQTTPESLTVRINAIQQEQMITRSVINHVLSLREQS
jgi:thymidylate kinase